MNEKSGERLTSQFVWREFFAFFSLEKGSLHTLARLCRNPGKTIHAFLDGERERLTNPIRFLLMACAVVTAVFLMGMPRAMYAEAAKNNVIDKSLESLPREQKEKISSAREMLTEIRDGSTNSFLQTKTQSAIEALDRSFAMKYAETSLTWMNAILLLALPINAFISWLFFRSAKLNFTEHIVANAYIIGIQNLASVFLIPLAYFNWVDLNISTAVYMLVSFAYQFVAWKQVFRLRGILSSLIGFFALFLSLVAFIVLQAVAMGLILFFAS